MQIGEGYGAEELEPDNDPCSLAKRWQNKGRNEDHRLDQRDRDCAVNITARQTASLCCYGYWHTAGRRLDT